LPFIHFLAALLRCMYSNLLNQQRESKRFTVQEINTAIVIADL